MDNVANIYLFIGACISVVLVVWGLVVLAFYWFVGDDTATDE